MSTVEPSGFASWAHVEAMGHRSHWGSVTEQTIAGAAFLRVDEFRIGDETARATAYYPPGSIYCITPCSEESAREMATPWAQRPGHELDAAPVEVIENHCPECGEYDSECECDDDPSVCSVHLIPLDDAGDCPHCRQRRDEAAEREAATG